MKLGVMQPYIFPYLGYFQLLNHVDQFVFFDDVNFIKGGWINRNQILTNHEPHMFSIPLKKASQNKLINEIELSIDEKWFSDFNKKIQFNYKSAPYYNQISEVLNYTFLKHLNGGSTIADLTIDSIVNSLNYLQIDKKTERSSLIKYDRNGNGESKIISICKVSNASSYINPINGKHLYNFDNFKEKSIELSFIKMNESVNYKQFSFPFVPNLSMLDILMFNSKDSILKMLNEYHILQTLESTES